MLDPNKLTLAFVFESSFTSAPRGQSYCKLRHKLEGTGRLVLSFFKCLGIFWEGFTRAGHISLINNCIFPTLF